MLVTGNLSETPDQEWQDVLDAMGAGDDTEFAGWDLIPEDERPPGVVADDPVVEEEKELNIDELETVASEEIVEVDDEEQFEDADEGQAEAFIDDDDDDLAVVGSFEYIPEDDTARGDPSPMDVDRKPKGKVMKPKKKPMPKTKDEDQRGEPWACKAAIRHVCVRFGTRPRLDRTRKTWWALPRDGSIRADWAPSRMPCPTTCGATDFSTVVQARRFADLTFQWISSHWSDTCRETSRT